MNCFAVLLDSAQDNGVGDVHDHPDDDDLLN
jgi:hypothetical protein